MAPVLGFFTIFVFLASAGAQKEPPAQEFAPDVPDAIAVPAG